MRKMKALTVKMQTVTLIGKGRMNLTCFVFEVYEINSKILFLSGYFTLGGYLRIQYKISLGRHAFWGVVLG